MEFYGKPAIQPSATGLTVSVIKEDLDKVMLIDELTTKEEHVAIVIHVLEIGLEGIGAALARRSGIGGVMVEKRVPSKCQDGSETSITWLVEVQGRTEEVRHIAIFDQVGAGQEEQATHKGNGVVQGVSANSSWEEVPEDTIGIVFTQVKRSWEIEAMGATVSGDF
jgi:hypothetical protein